MADDDAKNPEPTEDTEASEEETPDSGGTFRAVGQAIGGFARRVGAFAATTVGRPIIPEALKEPLATARTLRFEGERDKALARLRAVANEHPNEPFVALEMALTHLHDLLEGGRPIKALEELHDAIGEDLGRGAPLLVAAGPLLASGDPGRALDLIRRAMPELRRLPDPLETEAMWLTHVMAGLAQLRLGNEERSLRELQKARARTPSEVAGGLRRLILRHGVELALIGGQVLDAESWVREALRESPDDDVLLATLARVMAAKGDSIAAHALLEKLTIAEHARTYVWVGLSVGLPHDAPPLREVTLRLLQTEPDSPDGRRLWALAELETSRTDPLSSTGIREVLSALVETAAKAAHGTRDRHLAELAHAALRLDDLDESVVGPIARRLEADTPEPPPEELRLLVARRRQHDGEAVGPDLLPTVPPVFRADPEIGGPWGPDPQSPLRNADLRSSVLSSERKLIAAQACLNNPDLEDLAGDLLVEALVVRPEHHRARTLLGEATLRLPSDTKPRLEDLLTASTSVLASVPGRIHGVSLDGVEAAMSRVVAARERLARPLTIATMGEFSAGKSTFVNALLGEAIAPMGVLPTTTTINVFRRGTGGGARVHYRDGRIGMIDKGDVQGFLHGLDDDEAQRIRHMEIERTGSRMGDAAVVDTPGLNALDEYHEQVAREFLDEADAVVWVFSATRSGAASEVGMLTELRESGRQVLGVLNKVDTLDESEQKELANYLRDQLGEVLVEVVPLRGNDALKFRTEGGGGSDPFAAVETALDTHFLRKARELKRALTARRLLEALEAAKDATLEAITALEQGADEASRAAEADRPTAASLLMSFGDSVIPAFLTADDVLVREGLGLGLLQTKKGLAKGPIDPLDAEYLGTCMRESVLGALQKALMEVAAIDPAASEVLDQQFLPWARGHLDGLMSAGYITELLNERGKTIAEGEGAARQAFREALVPLAEGWAAHARTLVQEVERARQRFDRSAASKPRAEALRLRTSLVTTLDGLSEMVRPLATR